MLELTDMERWQLVSTLLTAKFQSVKSEELCNLEVINKVIRHCLEAPITDSSIRRIFNRFNELDGWEIEPLLPAVLCTKDMKDAGLITSEKEVTDTLSECLFPYKFTKKAQKQALKIINGD